MGKTNYTSICTKYVEIHADVPHVDADEYQLCQLHRSKQGGEQG